MKIFRKGVFALTSYLKQFIRLLTIGITAFLLVLSSSGVLEATQLAQNRSNQVPIISPEPQKPIKSSPTTPPTTAIPQLKNIQEIETFFDQHFRQQMQNQNIPGGVVALVKDGSILFTKGYGYANREENIPVKADRTLFRVASISKLFTDTAVMQLYEKGLVNLDTDVNQYLKEFQLDSNYSDPVTLAHLMTQTDGTSQRLLGIAAKTADKMTPLQEFLPQRMPEFELAPGQLYTYSNMSIALAGYIVESVSGIPFADYIAQNILQPLSMQRSSFEQPLPSPLASDLAVGYQYQGGKHNPLPFLYLNVAPAAALSATATDIAHFMIAHLQNGSYKNSRILQPETTQLMHEQQFTHHPKLPGTGYGFHERVANNLRAIGHSGNMIGYSSTLSLIPSKNIGIFIAFNSFAPVPPGNIVNQFIDKYYPASAQKNTPPQIDLGENIQRFAGSYRDVEYPRDTFSKLTAPFGHFHLKVNDNGTLRIETPALFLPKQILAKELIPVEPLLFRRAETGGYTAFGEDENGNISYVFNPVGTKIGAFAKIPFYQTVVFQLWVLGICGLLFLSSFGVGLGEIWHGKLNYASGLAMAISGLYVVFFLVFGLTFWLVSPWKLAYGAPIAIKIVQFIPIITAILSLGLLFFSVLIWQNKTFSWFGRIHYTLITLAGLLFVPLLIYWNLFFPSNIVWF